MNSSLHREIARQREAQLRREAEHERRVRAGARRSELPGLLAFTPVMARWNALGLLTRRHPQPGV